MPVMRNVSVFTQPGGVVHVIWMSLNNSYVDEGGSTRTIYTEPDMAWILRRCNLPKDFLDKLCALELSPLVIIPGVGRKLTTDGRGFSVYTPPDIDLVSYFPLPALQL